MQLKSTFGINEKSMYLLEDKHSLFIRKEFTGYAGILCICRKALNMSTSVVPGSTSLSASLLCSEYIF